MMRWSVAGLLSLMFNPIFFLLVLRLMGMTTDPLDIIFRLTIAQICSFIFSFFLTIALNWKARSPTR